MPQKPTPPPPLTASVVKFIPIDDDRAGQRIDNFLMTQLKGAPKSLIYRIVRKGEVRVNKGRIKPDYKLKNGDLVRVPPVKLPAPNAPPAVGKGLEKQLREAILYESAGLLIINKPHGLAVHGGSGINLGLIESLRQLYPNERSLELVHRLDRDTSGCIMVAKKRSTLRAIHAQLREGGIDKVYQALVIGGWPRSCQKVDAPLMKNVVQSGERMVRVAQDGKRCITSYRVLQNFGQFTLIEAKPLTGRTHQIRGHRQHMGHPIVGDPKYGVDDVNLIQRQLGLNRLFLHAAQLRLVDPSTDKKIDVRAPLDQRLQSAVDRLC